MWKKDALGTCRPMSGFSLVELIVVLFILSALLFVAIPRFSPPHKAAEGRKLAEYIQTLKQGAVKKNQDYCLHLDVAGSRVWVGIKGSPEGGEDAHRHPLIPELEGLHLKGVEMINRSGLITTEAVIGFFARGYSDSALIRMGEGNGAVTLKISPFLWNVDIIEGHISFYDCI